MLLTGKPAKIANRKHFPHWIYLLCGCAFSAQASAALTLADNNEVLQAWQRLSQNEGQAPTLSDNGDGSTTVEWHGAATLDRYSHTVSGNASMSPLASGQYYKASIQGDLRETSANGTLSYLQFSASNSNDRSVISQYNQVEMIQSGVVGIDYALAFGDVATSFSTLGTNTSLRGLYGYKQFGNNTLYASVGTIAESWEAYANEELRSRYQSDAYAIKLEHAIANYGNIYLTTQRYIEDKDSLLPSQQAYNPTAATTHTAGLNLTHGAFGLQAEYGRSSWGEIGSDSMDDSASVVDGVWQGTSTVVRIGHHDIGRYYSSLSADMTAGIRESYLTTDWAATDNIGLNVDLRRSHNAAAFYDTDILDTDAASASVNLNLQRLLNGLQLSLQHSRSLSKTVDDSDQTISSNGATATYASTYWGMQLGNTSEKVDNAAWPDTNSKTDTWNANLNFSLNRNPNTASVWSTDLVLNASWQNQEMVSSADISNHNYDISLNGQRTDWGMLALNYGQGWLKQSDGGSEVRNAHLQFEASRNLGKSNVLKAYLRRENNEGAEASKYSQQTAGLQLSTVW